MIVKIVTKEEEMFLEIVNEQFKVLSEEDLPKVYVERYIFDDGYIGIYVLAGY